MQRYIIHLKNQNYSPKQANWLLNKARSLVSDIGVIVRDTRVATRHIEFDTSVPENSIEEVIRRFTTISPLSEYEPIVEKRMEKHEAITKAKDLFNNEKFWGAHEVLESVWKDAHHEEKDLLNGIILIAAAFVHDEKDESSICIAILSRAMKKLSKVEGLYFGMNLDEIKKRVLRIIETGRIERFTI
jgi:predicted metal-dependent hydrolase